MKPIRQLVGLIPEILFLALLVVIVVGMTGCAERTSGSLPTGYSFYRVVVEGCDYVAGDRVGLPYGLVHAGNCRNPIHQYTTPPVESSGTITEISDETGTGIFERLDPVQTKPYRFERIVDSEFEAQYTMKDAWLVFKATAAGCERIADGKYRVWANLP